MRQGKRMTAFFLSLALLLTMLPGAAWAAETEELPEEAAVTEEATTETDEAQETSPESSVSGETEDDEASETEAEDEPAVVAEKDISTASEIVDSGKCGNNATYTLTSDGTLTISGTGALNSSAYSAFSCNDNIVTVIIEDGITSIYNSTFISCENLASVTIPDSVTSIGSYAFANCDSLSSVAIGNGVTSIGGSAFQSCNSLTSVTIPDSVTSIGSDAFWYCSELISVTIGSGVTSIGSSAFEYCTNLISVTIGSGVTSIGNAAFEYCSSLTDIYYGGSKYDWVCISIGSYNTYLTNATIHYGTVYEDSYIVDSGSCGDNVTYTLTADGVLTISGTGDMTDWSSESDAPWYIYRSLITSVTIEDGVTSIGEWAFYYCNMTSVTIPDSVTSISRCAFYDCSELISVTIPGSVTSIGSSAFKYCTNLISVTIGSGVTSIGDDAFYWCTSLTEVTIPDSVTSIGEYAFYYCNMTSVTIPDSVTSIGEYAFYHCNSLTSVTIGSGVTSIRRYAFSDCYSLTEVTIPDSVTSIGWCAFSRCTSLTEVTIPDGVTSIGSYAFYYCNSLTEVTIPDSVTSIGEYAFYNCKSLTDVYYSGSKSDWAAISIGSNNTCLTSATIHYGVEEPEHTYGSPVWTWASNYSSATAKFTCIDGDDTQTVTATVTYKVTTAATYTAAGTGTYTATVTFNGKTYTDTKTVTIPMLVLTAPTITSLYNSTSGVSVGWDAVDGATEYIVWRLNNSTGKWEKCATTTGTTYLSTSPVSGTTYYYAIEAVNGDVTSGRGTQRYILYMATPKVSLENTTSGIKVSWNSVTGATSGYQVYRRTADTDYELLKQVSTSTTSYTDTTAEAGVRYYYIVRSVRGSARSAYASQYITRLTTPTGISVSNTKSGVQVTWSAVTGATSYQVWRKLSGSSSWSKVGTTTGTSYTSTGVTSGKTYVFTVKAVYNSSVSAYNTTGKTIMRLAEPTITLENLVGGLTASWNAVDGAEGYKLYRRSETGSYVLVATLDANTLTYTDKAAAAGVVYYYRVQAYSGSYTSSWTSQFNRRIGHTTLTLAKGEDGVVLTWTESGGCTGYYIYRMNEDGSYTRIKTITSAKTLTWTDTDVESGNSYTYYIRGYNGSSLGSYTPKNIDF